MYTVCTLGEDPVSANGNIVCSDVKKYSICYSGVKIEFSQITRKEEIINQMASLLGLTWCGTDLLKLSLHTKCPQQHGFQD